MNQQNEERKRFESVKEELDLRVDDGEMKRKRELRGI